MRTYTTVANQSLLDIAEQLYGNVDAVAELIMLNDLKGLILNPSTPDEVDLSYPIQQGATLYYSDTSTQINSKVLSELATTIITTGIKRPKVFSTKFNEKFA